MTKEEQDKMIIDNIPLIHKVIKDLHCFYKTDDEYQEYYDYGLEGLINGVKSYDNGISKPGTYLYTCIKNMIVRCFQLSEMDKRKINKMPKVSLNRTIDNDSNDTELGELIADERINIEEEVEKKLQIEAIIKELNSMKNQKDALAIKMYYGLDGYLPKRYDEIASEFGVSRNMICHRINRALNKLKERSRFIERKVFMKENKAAIETESGEILVFNEKEDKNKNVLEQVNGVLLEQLFRLKKLDMDDKENSKLEIARSNAISSTSKTILQTIGIQMMAEKQKYKFLQIGND